MDQGNAAVWASALGIAGTLLGALGGAFVQARSTRRQVADQEAADVRHRLRDERRAAYASFLDQRDAVQSELGPITTVRMSPEWREGIDRRELWAPANVSLTALQRCATTVAITGPDDMANLAQAIYEAMLQEADSLRHPGLALDEVLRRYGAASGIVDSLRDSFVAGAQKALAAPTR
ncbi:hypothetical protein ACIPSE_38025 [Streptomyces sp. NPDC090106]|uniref:hypothetical protein n=1 Tax=Streptomyces sp. NPDC090106 TaxID=3365946 RepID=UPI003827FADF